jgi:hypothetical protein
VDVNQLIERYPPLFRLAEAGSAQAISKHGPLPPKQIVSTSPLGPQSRRRSWAVRVPGC